MSIKSTGEATDLSAIREGADSAETTGVPHAKLLVEFADAVVAHDADALAALRGPIRDAIGAEGLVEVAAVAANFQRMVRIADGTGIPQEAPILALGGDVIEELSLRDLHSAKNTPATGLLPRIIGPLLRPIAPKLMIFASKLMARSS